MKLKLNNAVLPLIGVNILFFLLQQIIPNFTTSFALISRNVWSEPWILVPSMFLHGGAYHLLFNMYALYMFGPLIEQRIGTKNFILIYFLAGILSSLGFTLAYPTRAAVGASGAIMAILGLTIILLPNLRILFFFVIPMSMRTAGIVFILIDLFGVFSPVKTGIAHLSHLVGLACGLIYGYFLTKKKKKFYRKFSSSSHMDSDDINEYLRSGRI